MGDKGQFQYANYLHAKVNEYDVHIDPKKDINPSRPESDRRSRNAAKAKFDDYRDNPDAHRTARGRRNVQEGRHNGYKLTQGGGLTMKSEAGQDAQVIVKNIVENIRQLHVLTFQYGFAINFRHEAKLVELKGGLPDFNDLIEKFSGTSGDQAIVDLATKRALEVPQETA